VKLFVTGATGFIGSHFVPQAMAAGHEVTALRRSSESRPRIAWAAQPHWIEKPMEELGPHDFAGSECLVHLAAHSVQFPHDTLENCLQGNLVVPLRVFRSAHQGGVERFVAAGSCFEYGRSAARYEFIPPEAPLEPTTSYATSKAAASIAFAGFAVESGVRLSIQRIFHAFGEGEAAGRLWPSLRRAAFGGEDFPMTAGEQTRDFVPVGKVATDLLAACSDRSLVPGQARIGHVGTGRPQTVRQFCESWWRRWQASGQLRVGQLPYRPGEVMRYVPRIE
jgi:nucleoside-diphosphate-sugar epimerase